MPNDQDVAAYIGLDWGDRQHAVQIQAAAGGDQPLHVSYRNGSGGNGVRVNPSYYVPRYPDRDGNNNLHGVWDSGIISRAQGDRGWWAYAMDLRDAIPQTEAAGWRSAVTVHTAGGKLPWCTTPLRAESLP